MEELNELHDLNERLLRNNMGKVFEMNALNDSLKDLSPIEILMRAEGGFSTHDNYFKFNGTGDLISYATINDALEMYKDVV